MTLALSVGLLAPFVVALRGVAVLLALRGIAREVTR